MKDQAVSDEVALNIKLLHLRKVRDFISNANSLMRLLIAIRVSELIADQKLPKVDYRNYDLRLLKKRSRYLGFKLRSSKMSMARACNFVEEAAQVVDALCDAAARNQSDASNFVKSWLLAYRFLLLLEHKIRHAPPRKGKPKSFQLEGKATLSSAAKYLLQSMAKNNREFEFSRLTNRGFRNLRRTMMHLQTMRLTSELIFESVKAHSFELDFVQKFARICSESKQLETRAKYGWQADIAFIDYRTWTKVIIGPHENLVEVPVPKLIRYGLSADKSVLSKIALTWQAYQTIGVACATTSELQCSGIENVDLSASKRLFDCWARAEQRVKAVYLEWDNWVRRLVSRGEWIDDEWDAIQAIHSLSGNASGSCEIPDLIDESEQDQHCAEAAIDANCHSNAMADIGETTPAMPTIRHTKTQDRLLRAIWDKTNWSQTPFRARTSDVVMEVWQDEEKVSTALRPHLTKMNNLYLEANISLSISVSGDWLIVDYRSK